MDNIFSVFPKHIFIKDSICNEYLSSFENRIEEIIAESGSVKTEYLKVTSTHLTNSELHKDPLFFPLVDEISRHAFEFSSFLGYDIEKSFMLTVGNMWANVSDEGGYNFPHTHPGALISGAFYVSNEVDSNNLTFFDNYLSVDFPVNKSGEGYDRISVPCVPGRLVLFRSDFPHGTTPQVGKGKKITISFNLR